MLEKDLKCSFSKVCCVCYYIQDIKKMVAFCRKHDFKFYYIRHDDFDEFGNEKKRHWHFLIESDSYHRFNIKSLLTDTLKINLFQRVKSADLYLRYMIHIDYIDKKHYNVGRIVSNVESSLIDYAIKNACLSERDINRANFNSICLKIHTQVLCSLNDIISYCIDNEIKYSTSWTFTFKTLLNEICKN